MEDLNWVDIEAEIDFIGEEYIYSAQGREKLVEDGELTVVEDAFMQGYEEAFD